jgi:hypothetical protein
MIPDAQIEHYMLAAGHTPGSIQPNTLRRAFALVAEDAMQACAEIAASYPQVPSYMNAKIPSHGDELIRQSRTVAESCLKAVGERLKGGQ